MNAEQKEKFFRFCAQKTNELMNKYITGEVSARAKKISEAIKEMRYFDREMKVELANVLGVALEEPISFEGDAYRSADLVPGIVLIQVQNLNGNMYPINQPLLKVPVAGKKADYFLGPNGNIGDHLNLTRDCVRPATTEEIRRLTDAQLAYVERTMIIL